ncbi:MAG: DEAD/DEAH box helicase, partial [bacterium]
MNPSDIPETVGFAVPSDVGAPPIPKTASTDIEGMCEQALQEVLKRRMRQDQPSPHVGRLITAGSRLYREPPPQQKYYQQLAFICDDPGLLQSAGGRINAASFFALPTMGNNTWLKIALETNGIEDLFTEHHKKDVKYEDVHLWTHQARILHSLLATPGRTGESKHVICTLPHGSGRTTAALLAMYHMVVEQLASVLFVSPTIEAAKIVYDRIDDFLVKTAWRKAVTLQGFYGDGKTGRTLAHGEAINIVVATPEGLDQDLLRKNSDHELFLEDIALVVIDSAEEYYGTRGCHVSHLIRRMRRLAAKYEASPRFLVCMAPYRDAVSHAATLVGMTAGDFDYRGVTHNNDYCERQQRVVGIWSAPFRFTGADAQQPASQLTPLRLNLVDGLKALLNSLAFMLAHEDAESQEKKSANHIIVVCKDSVLTRSDAAGLMDVPGWNLRIVSSLNELS